MKYWLNGAEVSAEAGVSVSDRGLLLGDGLFETILCRDGKPVFFNEHWARLENGADHFDMRLPYSMEVIWSVLQEMALEYPNAAARLTLTRGVGPRGLLPPVKEKAEPTMLVSVMPLERNVPEPVSLIISDVRRNEGSPASSMKTLAYIDNILAKQDAKKLGAGDAVMLNNKGEVACITIGNIFVLTPEKRLVTPHVEAGILPGIVRAKVLQIAREISLPVEQRKVFPDELKSGEVFVTNSLQGLRAAYLFLVEVDKGPLPSNLFLELQQQYEQKIKLDIMV